MPRDAAWLKDMHRFATYVVTFLGSMSEDAFLLDLKTQGAVLHYITLLGEAARRISQGYRDEHPEVDWQGIVSVRNRIVHEYDQYNLDVVWPIVKNDVPKLLVALEPLIAGIVDGEED